MSEQLFELKVEVPSEYDPEFPLDRLPEDFICPEPLPDFVNDIKLRGVINPIRINIFPKSNKIDILAGNRRVKAARLAGLETIPAIIYREKELSEALWASISADNSRRTDNPMSDLALIDRYFKMGYSESDVARICGIPVGRVRKTLKLLGLSQPLREAFGANLMKPTAAFLAASLPPERQAPLIEKAKRGEKIAVSDVMGARHARSKEELATLFDNVQDIASFKAPDQYIILNGTAMPQVYNDLAEAQLQAARLGPDYKVFKLIQI